MTVAIIALVLAAASYLALRWTEESRRLSDLIGTVLNTPLAYEDELCDVHGQWCHADWCHSDWCQR